MPFKEQEYKLDMYLDSHFQNDSLMCVNYLKKLYQIVNTSTVCLMGHERKQTLNLIESMARQFDARLKHERRTNDTGSDLSNFFDKTRQAASEQKKNAAAAAAAAANGGTLPASYHANNKADAKSRYKNNHHHNNNAKKNQQQNNNNNNNNNSNKSHHHQQHQHQQSYHNQHHNSNKLVTMYKKYMKTQRIYQGSRTESTLDIWRDFYGFLLVLSFSLLFLVSF